MNTDLTGLFLIALRIPYLFLENKKRKNRKNVVFEVVLFDSTKFYQRGIFRESSLKPK